MKIHVPKIPDAGLEIREEEPLEDGLGKAGLSLTVQKSNDTVIVRGEIRTDLNLQCGRCLKDFTASLAMPVDLAFIPLPAQNGAEEARELEPMEMNTGFYAEDEIDLSEVCKEQVLLQMPMRPLCSPDCKGLCQKCGANLNEKKCGCSTRTVDPRLQVLEKLLDKKGKEQN